MLPDLNMALLAKPANPALRKADPAKYGGSDLPGFFGPSGKRLCLEGFQR